MSDHLFTSKHGTDSAEGLGEGPGSLILSGVNMDVAIDNPEIPSSEAPPSDEVIWPYEPSRPQTDVPTWHNFRQVFNSLKLRVWYRITNTIFRILRKVPYSQYHVTNEDSAALARGFTTGGVSADGSPTTALDTMNTPEQIATDYGGELYQSRMEALSQRTPRHFEHYEAHHQRFASISRSTYETRLHPLKPVPPSIAATALAMIKKKCISFHLSHAVQPSGHQFWAVLIGIDAYSNPLRGCVADALMIEKYLTTVLKVPEDRIQYLLGKRSDDSSTRISHISHKYSLPTRENIIDTLLGLSENPDIKKGDSIIIFFSGHGSSYHCTNCDSYIYRSGHPTEASIKVASARKCHRDSCPIEALCPMDRGDRDCQGTCVPDISDREINNILAHIYCSTGARITMILDCCHAGGATKAPLNGFVRTSHSLPPGSFEQMLNSAKERLGDWDGYRDVWAAEWIPDMGSHIVLAACKDYQFAKELPGKDGCSGVFTEGLVKALTSGSLKQEATYTDLLEALPIYNNQVPVLAGDRKQVPLWL